MHAYSSSKSPRGTEPAPSVLSVYPAHSHFSILIGGKELHLDWKKPTTFSLEKKSIYPARSHFSGVPSQGR
jgi:hypothetical protein